MDTQIFHNKHIRETSVLATVLQYDHSITTLDLSCNKIDDIGIQALADALQVNHSLTTLDLSYNQLGSNFGQILANALQVNPSLTTLVLSNVPISNISKQALKDVARNRQHPLDVKN